MGVLRHSYFLQICRLFYMKAFCQQEFFMFYYNLDPNNTQYEVWIPIKKV